MAGDLDVLNCGAGHLELKFDKSNAMETEKARRAVTDMLKRGYALFLRGEGETFVKVEAFDPERDCYIVSDTPEVAGLGTVEPAPAEPKRRGRGRRVIPAGSASVTAVARSAGG